MRAALTQMQKQKSGSVVNIVSIYESWRRIRHLRRLEGMTKPAVYGAMKDGILQLSKYLASIYGPDRVRVNTLSTDSIFDNQDPIFVKRYNAKTMLKRMGTPEDVAGPVAFLLSDSARYITGHNLMVDGGFVSM